MFKGAKKEDLRQIAFELGETVTDNMTVVELTNVIKSNETFVNEPEFVKDIANTIISERKLEKESELELERIKFERTKAELELARIQAESKIEIENEPEKTESLDSLIKSVRTLTVKVPSKPEGWSYFFSSLERAFVTKSVPDKFKSEILLNLLGDRATNVITYIKDNELSDYSKVKSIVLREFEPTPLSCLEHFKKTHRQPSETHVQFASRLITSWDYYLQLRKVSDFETLKELIISDKIYQTLDKDVAYHVSMKQGDGWFKPTELAKEIDLYYTSHRKNLVTCSSVNYKHYDSKNAPRVFLSETKSPKCVLLCNENHPLYKCPKYKKLSVNDRVELVKTNNFCFNCLLRNHKSSACKSKYSCGMCQRRHHVTLHFRPADKQSGLIDDSGAKKSSVLSPTAAEFHTSAREEVNHELVNHQFAATGYNNSDNKTVLLSTCICYVTDGSGNVYPIRALMDVGASSNFMSQGLADRLRLRKEKTNISVSGLNNFSLTVKYRVNATITNEERDFKLNLDFLVVPQITSFTPSKPIMCHVPELQFVKLADSSFNKPGPVDLLLGAEHFYEFLRSGQIYPLNTKLMLQNTVFGYIVSGSIPSIKISSAHCGLIKDNRGIEESLNRFWDLESIGIKDDGVNDEEDKALENFNKTVCVKKGRYEVTLPWKKDWAELKDNFNVAKKRLESLTKRMKRDISLYSEYSAVIKNYLNEGIIEEVLDPEKPKNRPVFYLPHQIVIRKESITTKLRIVFDASAHEIGELSLNDCLFQGENLNPNIIHLLINFRLFKVAFLADIEKAFLQISLSDKDRDAVRFLVADADGNIKVYKFNRVLFGVKSSPYLLSATIKNHIAKYRQEFPAAVEVLENCFYVDDLIAGEESAESAFEVSLRAKKIMKNANMNLRKWISNDAILMKKWSEEDFDLLHPEDLEGKFHRVLGLSWDPRGDYISLDVNSLLEFIQHKKNTKRFLLMAAGRIFDPLGLITPFTIRFKCLFQEIWQKKLAWDEELPPDISEAWEKWCAEIPQITNIRVPRYVLHFSEIEEVSVEIHAFSDASAKAYGAVVYMKTQIGDRVSVNFVASKTRVAPLKKISLPRMELMGALLAARIVQEVKKVSDRKRQTTCYFWTDSKVALYWIQSSPNKWKSFVSNRVKEIQTLTNHASWHHCPGKDNPADLLSRGVSINFLLNCEKWWTGPDYLRETISVSDEQTVPQEEYFSELKKNPSSENSNCLISIEADLSVANYILNLSNNFMYILRVLSFIFRFCYNVKNPNDRKTGPLSAEELNQAEIFLIKVIQAQEFSCEVKSLTKGEAVSRKSKLSSLAPFIDENNVIRVGGRLRNSDLNYFQKHPILLPAKNRFTSLIVMYLHKKMFHVGPQALLYHVREKYWPVNARNLCRKICHECVTCFRTNPVTSTQIMSDLPPDRVNQNFVFGVTGIDFCGPFLVRYKNQRKGVLNKVYVAIFVCLSTRAIHLEIVTDLTTQTFIACLKRFFSRRGKAQKIFTDNAKTFQGANAELKKLHRMLKFPEELLAGYLASEKVDWKFIPPKAPNFGGIWEAGVKSFKYHFKRIVGNTKLTLEEFLTVVVQIEGFLNSRPLYPMSSDPNDFRVLSPGHFLIGRPISSIVEPTLYSTPENRLSQWQKITKSTQLIWKRWSHDYLNNLQQRAKWLFEKDNVKLGTVVLIKEDDLPPSKWLIAKIIELVPSQDKKIRVVKLLLPDGKHLTRSVRHICILPNQ